MTCDLRHRYRIPLTVSLQALAHTSAGACSFVGVVYSVGVQKGLGSFSQDPTKGRRIDHRCKGSSLLMKRPRRLRRGGHFLSNPNLPCRADSVP